MADFVDLPKASRYKDTPLFQGTRGLEFGLMVPPPEAFEPDEQYSVHRVRRFEVGFLDKLSVLHYGDGNEILFWFVQLSNAMLDAEKEMKPGDELLIAPRALALQFRTRSSSLPNG